MQPVCRSPQVRHGSKGLGNERDGASDFQDFWVQMRRSDEPTRGNTYGTERCPRGRYVNALSRSLGVEAGELLGTTSPPSGSVGKGGEMATAEQAGSGIRVEEVRAARHITTRHLGDGARGHGSALG